MSYVIYSACLSSVPWSLYRWCVFLTNFGVYSLNIAGGLLQSVHLLDYN